MSHRNKAIIIGCGSIGALKADKYDSRTTPQVLTWGHACYSHESVDVVEFVDSNARKAMQAAEKWDGWWSNNITSALEDVNPNIIIVATPTETHYDVLKIVHDIISKTPDKPRVVICEKPFCTNLLFAREIANMYRNINVPIIVGYLRRFNEHIIDVSNDFFTGVYGKIYHCKVTYTRGLLRDGSHAIDLCRNFFGDFEDGYIVGRQDSIDDFGKDDLTYACHISFENCPHVFFCPVDGRAYDVFDIDIYAEKGRVLLTDHSKRIEIYQRKPEAVYGNYDCLDDSYYKSKKTELETKTMLSMLDNAINVLDRKGIPICDAEDAIQVHKIYETLISTYINRMNIVIDRGDN